MEESLPAWATILAALGAGAIGALLTTWIRGRHERAEAWRDRLVPAADELATDILQAILALRDASRAVAGARVDEELKLPSERAVTVLDLEPVQAALQDAERCCDEAHARLARVQILFGVNEPPTIAAQRAIAALRATTTALKEWPVPDEDQGAAKLEEAHEALESFATFARKAIERGR
jgi:hypothetical protein